MTVKIYFEPLYHCTCAACNDWWNISDKDLLPGSPIYCSNCGAKHEIPPEIHTKSEAVKLIWADGEWVRVSRLEADGKARTLAELSEFIQSAATPVGEDADIDFDPDDYPLT